MLKSWGDRQIKPMIDHFFTDEENKIVLIVLSKMDFVSYDILKCFFEDDIENVMKIIDEMMYYGIVTIFGPNEEFFRLDHYFSDYIKRCKLRLSPDEEALFNDILEKKISSTPDITEDASVYLYEKKQIIIKGRGRANDFLIPSVVVSAVMDLYNQQKFKLVITVCYMVLNDVHNYYPDQERELRYWLCLSLARTTDKRFFDEIKLCNKNDADYYFLRGFYCRNNEEYYEAEQFYDKALWKSPSMQRAKREMVTALLAQDKYEDALEMARENYESSPENSYQIHGYFRCLVRKSTLSVEDKETLNILMKAMQTNLSDKHEELYAAMNIEYQWYINSLPLQEMQKMISEAKVLYPNSLNIGKVASEYKKYVNSEYV